MYNFYLLTFNYNMLQCNKYNINTYTNITKLRLLRNSFGQILSNGTKLF